ncbi:MAG: L-glutamate gamma-semialdehyde dehydrogenase [Thermomicrobiales bacterium]|nr:L-glutamate gamma-semialdehyde dehydrogenase [Thermomicrobiales bacterium]
MNAHFRVPAPWNEPVRAYLPGSAERQAVLARLAELSSTTTEIPMTIGGQRRAYSSTRTLRSPHRHALEIARYQCGTKSEFEAAVDAALAARRSWAATPFSERSAVFLRAAALLAGPWRDTVVAATMLGQSKTVHQAEIDAACELIDFWRFNVAFAEQLLAMQPSNDATAWNRMEYRPLEGFIYAVTPFNFTSIAGNLPTAPALMGNTVVFKPATHGLLAAHFVQQLLEEAGLPPGVINLVSGNAAEISEVVLANPDLAGIHFTGSTAVFQQMWRTVGDNIGRYRAYPRLVGETGGKDFVIAHESADVVALKAALIRGAFEYQGQKCSAASRAYIPCSMWEGLRDDLAGEVETIAMGDPADTRNFMGAVIDRAAFTKHAPAIELARTSADARIIAGGETDDSVGWFVRPTVIETSNPGFQLLQEELFGPILTVYPYPDGAWSETLDLVDRTSPYGLTGSVFATDRAAIDQAASRLVNAAGNFYINDKPTGAVVGQQPFGGARASGTNDKAGSLLNLIRWTSPRSIKETYVPPRSYRYPFMEESSPGA